MILYPSLDILDGTAVKLVGGKRGTGEILGDPLELALAWRRKGARWLHLVDLNAAFGRGDNKCLIRNILETVPLQIQVGGGIRNINTLKSYLDCGARRVIVGTRGIQDIRWLRRCALRFPCRVVLAVDAMGYRIVTKGWREKAREGIIEFAQRVKELPLAALLYTNVTVEGRGQGVDWRPIEALKKASRQPVIFSGGITTVEEIKHFREIGAQGIIIGMALYKGIIDFRKAMQIAGGKLCVKKC